MPKQPAKPKPHCIDCDKVTYRVHPILGLALCADCRKKDDKKYGFITKTRALQEYRIKPAELIHLQSHEVDNPHYKKAAPMQLFLHSQIRELAKAKWGSSEPYVVTLVDFSNDFLAWLSEDMERIKQLTSDQFQRLIADRLDNMGLGVQLVGDVFRKDGGVDIIAYPKPNTCAFPFLLGVQTKHHHTGRKTGSPDVRDFHGVLTSRSSPFHFGMIITNTEFTADAKWVASNNQTLLRLRDLHDLRRWLQNDYTNDQEWREIPDEFELAPGIRIVIPKPKIITPRLLPGMINTPTNRHT